jgi:replicative DNA helicase
MGKTTIHTIESHIKKVIDLGIQPDLILIDYIDLLSTRKRNVDRKGEIDDIYTSTKGLARELNIPIWSVSQVNRAGAKDDVIEGDKAAGSYDKMMITDLSMSLSRKKEDKVNGTGRLHIMKNRYGMDGLTFQVDVNTSNGHISIGDHYDEEADTVAPKKPSNGNFDDLDRQMLSNKFFELNT